MTTLKAEKRNMQTKAKKLRREGFVTGNVFGREMKESMPIQIAKTDAERLIKSHGKGSQIMLDVDGQMMDVLVKEIDLSPLKTEIYEIDFQALVKGEKVHSVAEVILLNHEKVNTGLVNQMLHEIAFKAEPSALVEKIEIDVGDMKLGDSIQVKDLDIAKNKDIDLVTNPEATVVSITEIHNQPVGDEEAEEETEA